MLATATCAGTIDPASEDPYIPLDDSPRYIPGRPHRATVWRWALTGVMRRGQRVRLRTTVVGGRRFVTREDIAAFIAACAAGDPSAAPAPAPTMTRARREQQGRAAMAALQAGR